MKTFLCEVERDGKTQRQMIKAESLEQARKILIDQQWNVVKLTEITVG